MKAGVDTEFKKIRKEFGDLKEDTAKIMDEKNQEIKVHRSSSNFPNIKFMCF